MPSREILYGQIREILTHNDEKFALIPKNTIQLASKVEELWLVCVGSLARLGRREYIIKL